MQSTLKNKLQRDSSSEIRAQIPTHKIIPNNHRMHIIHIQTVQDLHLASVKRTKMNNLTFATFAPTKSPSTRNYIDSVLLKRFVKVLKPIKHIQNLIVNCNPSHDLAISDRDVKYLKRGIKGLSLLKKAQFTFKYCEGVTSQGISNLLGDLKHLKEMTKIELGWREYRENPSSESIIKRQFRALKALIALQEINLLYTSTVTSSTELEAFGQGCRSLKPLKKLYLHVCDSQFIDDHSLRIQSFCASYKDWNTLEYLNLDLDFTTYVDSLLEDEAVDKLSEALKTAVSLRNLTLKFFG